MSRSMTDIAKACGYENTRQLISLMETVRNGGSINMLEIGRSIALTFPEADITRHEEKLLYLYWVEYSLEVHKLNRLIS